MKIYIAGKVTNEPVMACIEKFQKAKAYIESLGHQAVIPFEIPGMVFGISHAEDLGNVILFQKDQSLRWSVETLKTEIKTGFRSLKSKI